MITTRSTGRGSGRTLRQMQLAPLHAVFVWCSPNLYYPIKLAHQIGRNDLRIVAPNWLADNKWRGLELTGLVVDHAANLTEDQKEGLEGARCRFSSHTK
jgi:hypothetical protein